MKTHVKAIYTFSILNSIIGFILTYVGVIFSSRNVIGWAAICLIAAIILFIIGDLEQHKQPPQKDENPYSL
jgi:hypothetical protein